MALFKRVPRWLLIVSVTCVALSQYAFAQTNASTTFTFRSSESPGDMRYNYDSELLELVLRKTQKEYGPYVLISSPNMNFSRAVLIAKKNQLPNFILKLSYSDKLYPGLSFAEFPVDLGVVGYRVCFTHKPNLPALAKTTKLEELKAMMMGGGKGWIDNDVLRFSGFNVMEIALYESMFSMLATGRYDLLCRGANEILAEWNSHQHLEGIAYDKSMALHYPLPRFFYSNTKNKKTLERLEKGLIAAYHDGSLRKLWRKHYQQSIEFSELMSRRVFYLENPDLNGLSERYKDYLYDPFQYDPFQYDPFLK